MSSDPPALTIPTLALTVAVGLSLSSAFTLATPITVGTVLFASVSTVPSVGCTCESETECSSDEWREVIADTFNVLAWVGPIRLDPIIPR